MAKRDAIEEFMKNYGRLYDRLEPRDQAVVRKSLEEEMEQLRSHPMAGGKDAASIDEAVAHDFQVWEEIATGRPEDQTTQQDRASSASKTQAEIEEGMWEENETERTAYRFWKPERAAEASDRPLEFPADYRLDALVPWESGTSQLDEGVKVYEMTGHEWLKEGDIVTTPEGQGYVVDATTFDGKQSRDAPDFAWGGSYSETVNVSDLALDKSKGSPDPGRSLTEAEKREAVKDFGHIIDAHEAKEASYVSRLEAEIEARMWSGKGQADERLILSGGQVADSWATSVRPEKGPQDFRAALKSMGIEKAAERQAARDESVENTQERGGEGIEP